MSVWLLYLDELKGFYKSKVMLALWVGLPVAAVLFHYLMRDVGNTSITLLAALVVSAIGGTLGSVMLSTTVVNEKIRHVYELFLIRPVKRYALVLGKFFAVLTCLVLANALSIAAGLSIDAILQTVPPSAMVTRILEAISTGVAVMSIACALGLLFGVAIDSIPFAAILSIYLGNQLSALAVLPSLLLPDVSPILFNVVLGGIVTPVLLVIAVLIFNRKQF